MKNPNTAIIIVTVFEFINYTLFMFLCFFACAMPSVTGGTGMM